MDLVDALENDGTEFNEDHEAAGLQEDKGVFKSAFASLYKVKSFSNQERRREDLLVSIKVRRNQMVDEKRNLNDFFEDDDEDSDNLSEPMEVTQCSKKKRRRKRKVKFEDALMLSEWFAEVPPDLEKNWLVKMCPVGVRNLIIAHNGTTHSFNRKGKILASHTSFLPGGGPNPPFHKFTILDCIFAGDCYYVLDILAWNSFSLKKSNTEMRFYWVKSKLEETPELQIQSEINPFVFCEINYYPADLPLIEEKLSRSFTISNTELPLDGILFYHRETSYLPILNPLVGWLKPYMIPEMLHIPVNDYFIQKKPKHYISLSHYLENKIKHRKKQPPEKMDF